MSAPSRSPLGEGRARNADAGQRALPELTVSIEKPRPQIAGSVRDVRRGLEVAGVTVTGDACDCRLILFERHTPELMEQIQSCEARSGRVVAVHVGAPPLTGEESLALLAAGASDVLEWDARPELGHQLRARLERWAKIDALVTTPAVATRLVGQSPRWRAVVRELVEVAAFSSSSILITGESGTGKELAARLVHELDERPDKRELVLVDCTTIVPTLSGSEFFGHERGAFTGAVSAREGAFALAHKGTLFLDEVGELPLTLQPELLRVVQEGAYKRVGSNAWHRTVFRLVCATNRDLFHEVGQGRFRHDLYHRIAAWRCALPSLHERRDDIPLLADHFLSEERGEKLDLAPSVVEFLVRRAYPGNVRELRHLVARLRHRHVGPGPITLADLPEDERALAGSSTRPDIDSDAGRPTLGALPDALRRAVKAQLDEGRSLREIVDATRETALEQALESEHGNVTRAAGRLGVTRRALQLRRAQFGPAAGDADAD